MALPNTNEHIHEDEGLWLVGFTIPYLDGMRLMSGMVDIVDVCIDPARNAVVFVVRNLDPTGCLFKTGLLKATKIKDWKVPQQSLVMPCMTSTLSAAAAS